eukprot:4722712-Pyramimonas_sp.AAC.1
MEGAVRGAIQRVCGFRVMVQGVAVQFSHLLGYVSDLQMHACLRCGCAGKHYVGGLAEKCSGHSGHYGSPNIRKLAREILPISCKRPTT